jgi:hypothetical protein
MSKASIGERLAAETTRRPVENTPASTGEISAPSTEIDPETRSLRELAVELQHSFISRRLLSTSSQTISKTRIGKHRFGLPEGFVSRVGRYGRSVLLEDNIYRLPNGEEFIPQTPSGTLGSRNHQYALLTAEQYSQGSRGSVYVRLDGRIFDYASNHRDEDRELFDTGLTIGDLERTGRYVTNRAVQTKVFKKRKVKTKRSRKRQLMREG